MAIKKVFKSVISSCRYVFRNGKEAVFINGEFITDVEEEISELMTEIKELGFGKSRHPHIYVDTNKKEVDTDSLDPLEAIKKKAVEEYLAKQTAAVAKTNDRGTSTMMPATTGMSNSNTIAQAAAGSDGAGAGSAQAANISAALASLSK